MTVIFYNNVVSNSLLDLIKQDRESKYDSRSWNVSPLFWKQNILHGVTGVCASCLASDDVADLILSELNSYFPYCDEYIIQHYVWLENSSISMHDDRGYKFGATLYLNDEWNMSYGGIFIYEDGDEYKAVCPEKNMLVVNTNQTRHMVTAVSPIAPEHRYTVQIWGA